MSQQNIEKVQRAYEAFGRGDVAAIIQTCSPDVVWEQVAQGGVMPTAGRRHGHAGVADFFGIMAEHEDITLFEPYAFHGDGDWVFVQGRAAGTVKRTGKSAGSEFVHIFEFKDGLLVRFREFMDTEALAKSWRD